MTHHRAIIGYGKKGGSGNQSSPVEAQDSLRSRQLASVVDLLCEGPIKGIVGGAAGVYLDGVQLLQSGVYNFQNVTFMQRVGTPTQTVMSGFNMQQQEVAVGVQLKIANKPANVVVRDIDNTDVDRCRVTVSTPQLQKIDKKTGNINGNFINFNIRVSNNGGGLLLIGNYQINGKTSSNYQRAITFALPRPGPWQIRIDRTSADSTGQDDMNDLFWDSYTELIDDKINYSNSAVVGLKLDAENFRSIPKRVYDVEGLIIRVPTNYDPDNATYTGVWDGNFKSAFSNNPAWCFYDLVINNRYGLGDFIAPAYVDKWALYAIGKWCDQRVPGRGGALERRYQCDFRITEQQEAFDLLAQLASIFRGWALWTGGMMVTGCDMPEDSSQLFTNANVLDGVFNYSSSDIRQKHTQVAVRWNDPAQLGQPRLAIVDDPSALSRYGIQRADMIGYGCTRESEAIRTGKWVLYSEQYEDEQINFKTGQVGASTKPGGIFTVMDVIVAGKRRGGRVAAGTTADHVLFDAPIDSVPLVSGVWYLSCIVGEGAIETRPIASLDLMNAYPVPPFSATPAPDTVFVVTETGDLEPTLWRCTSRRELDRNSYEINGVRYFPQKWDYVEKNHPFSEPDISDIVAKPPPIVNLAIVEYLVALSAISVGVRVTLSWTSKAPTFEVYYRNQSANENWSHLTTDKQAVDLPATSGTWAFQVTPVSLVGIKGVTANLIYTVIGLAAPPAAPVQFRVKISDGIALFEWLPATELDVIIGGHFELRHSSRTGDATWAGAQVVIPSIPGTATTVEAVYRVGTWFLRTFDSSGNASTDVATIIALQPDGRYTEYARICENPDFLGTHFFTEVMTPQQWLVIGQTGGMWDDQLANMDDWPDVDVLVEGEPDPPQSEARHGWYLFEDMIDAGGVFTIRFSADILAFPYQEGSEFIDDRLNPVDEWADWDDVEGDLGGQVQLYIRTTQQDPASLAAVWTDWQVFSPIEYTARGFQFRADLFAPLGQNIGVEELCIIADLRMKMDSAEDVPYPTSGVNQHVKFAVKFYLVPAVVITVQNALATDKINIVNKTREGFDLNIIFSSPPTNRTFDWQARGY